VSPKAIAVAGLSAIAIAASGCSEDSDAEAEFRAAFEKKFSAAPWYHHITGMEVTEDERDNGRPHIEVTTDLGPGDGRGLCGVIRAFALESGVYDQIASVELVGADGVERGGCA
jgi:hypothetical protein